MPHGEQHDRPDVVLLRDDLRVADNPALRHAVDAGAPLIVVAAVLDDAVRPRGGASRWWLHHSLVALDASLRKRGNALVIRSGAIEREIGALLDEVRPGSLWINRRYDRDALAQDDRITALARKAGITVHTDQASLLFEPGDVTTGDGGPFSVFTPFWRAAMRHGTPRQPLAAPDAVRPWAGEVAPGTVDGLGLLPTAPDWSGGIAAAWTPGEKSAHRRLHEFVHAGLHSYDDGRDRPGADETSKLSPHLAFGELSPFQLWHAIASSDAPRVSIDRYLSELGWREFDWHLRARHGRLESDNIDRRLDAFAWRRTDPDVLTRWQHGRTGIPLVDAGMRQLWETGWMHNRVRMITASFLVKNLRFDWRLGEQWFWDTLVDADLANNPAQWQWVAGSGADASPYFRVFNPVTQAKRFDPDGEYVHRWVPELRDVTGKALFEPWAHGVGEPPVVDLGESRASALDAYERLRSAAS